MTMASSSKSQPDVSTQIFTTIQEWCTALLTIAIDSISAKIIVRELSS